MLEYLFFLLFQLAGLVFFAGISVQPCCCGGVECHEACTESPGFIPTQWQVVIAGLVDGTGCILCNEINGGYTLVSQIFNPTWCGTVGVNPDPAVSQYDADCLLGYWFSPVDVSYPCSGGLGGTALALGIFICIDIPASGNPTIRVRMDRVARSFGRPACTNYVVEWKLEQASPWHCADITDLDIPLFSETGDCCTNPSAPTCTLTAL